MNFRTLLEAPQEGVFRSLVEADLNKTWEVYGPKVLRSTRRHEEMSDGQVKDRVFRTIEENDPTTNYTYARWIMQQMIEENLDLWGNILVDGQADTTTSLLGILGQYEKLRQRKKLAPGTDILQLNPGMVWKAATSVSGKSEKEVAEEGSQVVYRDANWVVRQINTYEASRYYGRGTSWCTAADSVRGVQSFDSYYGDGNDPLLVLISKSGEKFQMYIQSPRISSFHTEEDKGVDLFRFVKDDTEDMLFSIAKQYRLVGVEEVISNAKTHAKILKGETSVRVIGHDSRGRAVRGFPGSEYLIYLTDVQTAALQIQPQWRGINFFVVSPNRIVPVHNFTSGSTFAHAFLENVGNVFGLLEEFFHWQKTPELRELYSYIASDSYREYLLVPLVALGATRGLEVIKGYNTEEGHNVWEPEDSLEFSRLAEKNLLAAIKALPLTKLSFS